jgi:hypothetical protein
MSGLHALNLAFPEDDGVPLSAVHVVDGRRAV